MMDFTAMANAMYPTSNPVAEKSVAPTPVAAPVAEAASPESVTAAVLYADEKPAKIEAPSPEIEALRKDPERLMYPAKVTFRDAIPDGVLDAIDVPPEAKAAAVANFREMAGDLGLTTDDARTLVSASMVAAPDAATSAAWRTESMTALKEAYGDQAYQRLADAKLLVQRDPRIKSFLNASGLGDKPSVVLILVEKARQARVSGRLK